MPDNSESRLLVRALGPRRLSNLLLALGAGLALYCVYYALRGNWPVAAGGCITALSLLIPGAIVRRSGQLPSASRLNSALTGVNAGAVIAITALGATGVAWIGPLVLINLLIGGAQIGVALTALSVALIVALAELYQDIDLTANILGALVLSGLMAFAITISLRDHVGRLQLEASHDPLTGALNRSALAAILQSRIASLNQLRTLSLILIDIDHFKALNDTHGHTLGDTVLRQFVQVLGQRLRRADRIFRYGGEEFAVLVDADARNASDVAEKLRMAVAEYPFIDDYPITVSAGIAEARRSDTQHSLIERADRALYKAKAGGRNRCELADDAAGA